MAIARSSRSCSSPSRRSARTPTFRPMASISMPTRPRPFPPARVSSPSRPSTLAPVPTGTSVEGLEGLGVDLRLNARCNEDGELFSPAGDVTVYRDEEEEHWVLAIAVPGRRLPSSFGWIGFAQHDDFMLRVPEPPGYAVWAPYEGQGS